MNIKINWSNEKEIRRLFSWQARVGIAPKFGSRPIGWYQQNHCKVHEFLLGMAAKVGSYEATCRQGTIYLGKNHIGSVNYVFAQGDKR
jgi:hypothetical protein